MHQSKSLATIPQLTIPPRCYFPTASPTSADRTLDGCVKIYTNRVDSVATETGKLLSGLADSNSKKKDRGDDAEGEGEESDDELDEDGNVKKKPKKKVTNPRTRRTDRRQPAA